MFGGYFLPVDLDIGQSMTAFFMRRIAGRKQLALCE